MWKLNKIKFKKSEKVRYNRMKLLLKLIQKLKPIIIDIGSTAEVQTQHYFNRKNNFILYSSPFFLKYINHFSFFMQFEDSVNFTYNIFFSPYLKEDDDFLGLW